MISDRKQVYIINLFILQELRKACGAGFLIMINYIYNHMVYFTRMREFAWSVSDFEELVGLYNTFIFPSLYNEIGKELKNSGTFM